MPYVNIFDVNLRKFQEMWPMEVCEKLLHQTNILTMQISQTQYNFCYKKVYNLFREITDIKPTSLHPTKM